jgi:hypothetical protein
MKPDYSITKGYPYDGVMSRTRFRNRPAVVLNKDNKVVIDCDKSSFPDFKRPNFIQRLFAGKVIDFLLFRLFDYAEALIVSDSQVEHLLSDDPFIPEEFGFLKAVGPKEISDNPVKVYVSRYDDSVSLFRDQEKASVWHLLIRNEDLSFKEYSLIIPNHRIAYAVFFSLGIKVEEKTANGNLKEIEM